MIRRWVKIPLFCYDPRLSVQIARTQEDLEAAYALLHRSYVAAGLSDENPWGVRLNVFSFLPETTVVVVKFEGEVIGTVSLIRDSRLGLLTDSHFLAENNVLRSEKARLVEVSALAVDRQFRQHGHAISFLMMKYIYWYARFWMHGTHFVCCVANRAGDFYRSLFSFTQIGGSVNYSAVNSATGIYMQMPLSAEHADNFVRLYSRKRDSMSSFFLYTIDNRFLYPERSLGQTIDPVMNPQLLAYFLIERTRVIFELDREHVYEILEAYASIFGDLGPLEKFKNRGSSSFKNKEFRLTVNIEGLVSKRDDKKYPVLVQDLSTHGCFITLENLESLAIGDNVEIQFRHKNKEVMIQGQIRWGRTSKLENAGAQGFGVAFSESQDLAEEMLGDWGKTDAA